jgi:hypothetical protein
MNEEIHKAMMESYYDGGVSIRQVMEWGGNRPKIDDFLKFSSKYEGVPFRSLWTFGGLEFVYSYEEDFNKIGISSDVLASCVDADSKAIRFVCRAILSSLSEAKTLFKEGHTQLASRGVTLNPAAAKAFILASLDAKERYQENDTVPELYFLLSQILFPGKPEVEDLEKSKNLRFTSTLLSFAYLHKHGTYPSYRLLAKLLNVVPSTISRMFESREVFEKTVDNHRHFHLDPSTDETLKHIYPNL